MSYHVGSQGLEFSQEHTSLQGTETESPGDQAEDSGPKHSQATEDISTLLCNPTEFIPQTTTVIFFGIKVFEDASHSR